MRAVVDGDRRARAAAHPLSRVIYTESHDDVANGDARVPEAITPGDADGWWAKKRAVLGSALVLTSPGIPMLFQGQELLEDRWFDDTGRARLGEGQHEPRASCACIATSSPSGEPATARRCGLRGSNVAILRADQEAKVLAMHRWMDGGPHDDTVVVANFADRTLDDVALGFPAPGRWNVRFNSDATRLRPRLRRPRRVRPRRGRPAAGRLRPERAGLGRPVQRRDPVPGGRCAVAR